MRGFSIAIIVFVPQIIRLESWLFFFKKNKKTTFHFDYNYEKN